MSEKCPFCGELTLNEIVQAPGTYYTLTTVDTNNNPPIFNPSTGLAVKVKGCLNCGKLLLESPALKNVTK